MQVRAEWLGGIDYQRSLDLQQQYLTKAATEPCAYLLGCEYPPVISLGKRAQRARDLLCSEEWYHQSGIAVVATDRGGEATLHSPGQLIIYPILDICRLDFGVQEWVECLQTVTCNLLADCGVSVHSKSQAPGLYTDRGKLVFVGLRIIQGVSTHGLSINISNDLDLFSCIRPCGAVMPPLDRVANYGPHTTETLFWQWCERFKAAVKAELDAPKADT